jgi:hypothetical protein
MTPYPCCQGQQFQQIHSYEIKISQHSCASTGVTYLCLYSIWVSSCSCNCQASLDHVRELVLLLIRCSWTTRDPTSTSTTTSQGPHTTVARVLTSCCHICCGCGRCHCHIGWWTLWIKQSSFELSLKSHAYVQTQKFQDIIHGGGERHIHTNIL